MLLQDVRRPGSGSQGSFFCTKFYCGQNSSWGEINYIILNPPGLHFRIKLVNLLLWGYNAIIMVH